MLAGEDFAHGLERLGHGGGSCNYLREPCRFVWCVQAALLVFGGERVNDTVVVLFWKIEN